MMGNIEQNITLIERLKRDPEVKALIDKADENLRNIGYTDHGWSHVGRVSRRSAKILKELKYDSRYVDIAEVAGLLHDIGNSVNRESHAITGAMLAYNILIRHKMSFEDTAEVIAAIGHHDDISGEAVSIASAALIIADKSDVLKDRVRPLPDLLRDIHDRVNFAAKNSEIYVDSARKKIKLSLTIDVNICPIMEYFEIFLTRMLMCKRSANFLGCEFSLVINKTRLL